MKHNAHVITLIKHNRETVFRRCIDMKIASTSAQTYDSWFERQLKRELT